MKTLLGVTAVLEAATGVALLVVPARVVSILLGLPLDMPAGLALGRLAGAALLALGVACFSASRDARSRAAAGVVAALLIYNVAVIALFVPLGLGGTSGIGLWPVIALHTVATLWCIRCMRGRRDFLGRR